MAVSAVLSCDFSRVAGGSTIFPREGGGPLNFGAVNIVLRNILGAADGLTISLRNCRVDQAMVDLTAVSLNDSDQPTDFGLSEPRLSPPLYLRMSETIAPFDLLEFLMPQPAPPPYLAKA